MGDVADAPLMGLQPVWNAVPFPFRKLCPVLTGVWGLKTEWQRLPGTGDDNLFQNPGLCRFLNMDQSHPEPPDDLMQAAVTS